MADPKKLAMAKGKEDAATTYQEKLAQAKYDKAVNGSRPEEIGAAGAAVKRLESDKELARVQMARAEELKKDGAVTQELLDKARAA